MTNLRLFNRDGVMMKRRENVPCPHCGEDIPANASGCPHCGSDERTGWSDGTYMDGLDLPDEDEYEEIRRKEFGGDHRHFNRKNINWKMLIGLLLLVAFVLAFIC